MIKDHDLPLMVHYLLVKWKKSFQSFYFRFWQTVSPAFVSSTSEFLLVLSQHLISWNLHPSHVCFPPRAFQHPATRDCFFLSLAAK